LSLCISLGVVYYSTDAPPPAPGSPTKTVSDVLIRS
jgi:hypothetical protein